MAPGSVQNSFQKVYTRVAVLLFQNVLFVSSSFADELDGTDVPSAFTIICKPIVQSKNTCDIDHGKLGKKGKKGSDNDGIESDESIENQCICSNRNVDVASIAALCTICIQQNGNRTMNGKLFRFSDRRYITELRINDWHKALHRVDMDNIMLACSFSSTAYAPSATALVAQVTVSATKPSVIATGQVQATQRVASVGSGARGDVSSTVGVGWHYSRCSLG